MYVLKLVVSTAVITSCTAALAVNQPIVGGTTSVTFNDAFLDLPIHVSTIGAATLEGATATFPITGGSFDTNTSIALIEHDGSGLTLDDTASFLDLENFLINTSVPWNYGRRHTRWRRGRGSSFV